MGRELTPRQGEEEEWRARDPLKLYRQRLEENGTDAATLDSIEKEVTEEVADALQFARDSEPPEQAEAFDHVFVERLPIPDYLRA